MALPTPDQARALHEKYAPTLEAFDLVHGHCEIVAAIAAHLLPAAGDRLDADLVRAGALLHDIGVYRLYDDRTGRIDHRSYIRHGVLGHEILRAEGLPERLCRFCSCHTGVGLTEDDIRRQQLPLPVADYTAETPEEQLVMYADKFHTKSTPPRFLSAAEYAEQVQRFGQDKADAFHALRDRFGEPDLSVMTRTAASAALPAPRSCAADTPSQSRA